MNAHQLSGILILLLGLAFLVISIGTISHDITEKQPVSWFWYLLIDIGLIATILGGTLLYQNKYDKQSESNSGRKSPKAKSLYQGL
jgi:uncharacterized membrane protein HdeD (DUF308 family)